jgi:small-conductance mechanosensitive channel|uniref:C2H2-type domain-containing protein n=1 Tax=viral metagenome TaxID=1070528 RepID=A0A6C0IZ09_9ZZZZ
MECEYCKKTFLNKYNLKNHQKRAKFCLAIQKENNIEIDSQLIKCEYCEHLSTPEHLKRHKKTCKNKILYENTLKEQNVKDLKESIANHEIKNKELSDEIVELKHQMEILQTKNEMLEKQLERSTTTVEEIAKQPKVQNTTNNNNKILIATPLDLSKENIQAAIQNNFSDEYLTQGQKGVARFAFDTMLKDEQGKLKYICTDPSRQIFQYKCDDGTVKKDVKATKLTKAILDGDIKKTSHKIAWDKMEDAGDEAFMAYTDHYEEIQALETDNSQFSKELSTLVV